ncbi:NAD(P)/FAD-dependent oxidoreductase [Balneolaceae bacterium ANBcel3]|nr:NAD(P)/FAD-dependent oxidoreductase [Balneolaceae bacterium ANBcel3]
MNKRIQSYPKYDVIIVGSGMGGLTTASLLSRDGYRVLVLEASSAPGGCSSSYPRKGYIFESGATTLMGFDEHQPLARLENMLGISFPKEWIDPPMAVRMTGKTITRHSDRKKWLKEAIDKFGNKKGQEIFWDLVFEVSDSVWRLSEKNSFFPPQGFREWMDLAFRNDLKDFSLLKYRRKSVLQIMRACGIDGPLFRAFVDEQLMITAQNTSRDTSFLFGAVGLAYTCSRNYLIPGGFIEMARTLEEYIRNRGGEILYKKKVSFIELPEEQTEQAPSKKEATTTKEGEQKEQGNSENALAQKVRSCFKVKAGNVTYLADNVVTNIPIWNVPEMVNGSARAWFQKKAARYKAAWGAFVMGIAVEDHFPPSLLPHQQILLSSPLPHTGSNSVFVSISASYDQKRSPAGTRVLNVSCHTPVDSWDLEPEAYKKAKKETAEAILGILEKHLPGFSREHIKTSFEGTPKTFENWTHRFKGRVGGIPQSMKRSIFDWPPVKPPFKNWYLVGDTVYPGQGVPGVALGGIHAYLRIVADQSQSGNYR